MGAAFQGHTHFWLQWLLSALFSNPWLWGKGLCLEVLPTKLELFQSSWLSYHGGLRPSETWANSVVPYVVSGFTLRNGEKGTNTETLKTLIYPLNNHCFYCVRIWQGTPLMLPSICQACFCLRVFTRALPFPLHVIVSLPPVIKSQFPFIKSFPNTFSKTPRLLAITYLISTLFWFLKQSSRSVHMNYLPLLPRTHTPGGQAPSLFDWHIFGFSNIKEHLGGAERMMEI